MVLGGLQISPEELLVFSRDMNAIVIGYLDECFHMNDSIVLYNRVR